MIELRDYQIKAVRELKHKIVDMLNDPTDRQKLIFKAPTGSGKMVMVSTLLDELTRDLPMNGECRYSRVAWVWIAPNKLHQQSYLSMRNFFSERRSLRPVMFDECDHLEGLHPGDVLFLNWESINKDNAVMIRDNEQNRTLYELIRKTKVEQHLPVVVIIDEEHQFAGQNAKKSEMVLQAIQPHIELRVSATPKTLSYNAVVVKRQDVIEEEMIKKGIQLNPNVKSSKEQSELTVNQRLLKKALQKRKELAEAYKEYGINPLLLIQLPNDKSETLSSSDKTIAEEMQAYLEQVCNISVANGRLAVWLSKDKSPNLQNITHSDDITEVLLFKQAIAMGWDCPRASVLLIFREMKSMEFTTQTLGRILRMPEQRFYENDILNYGYVYTDLSTDMITIATDEMSYISTLYANRRKDLNNITLRSSYTDKHGAVRNRLGSQFRSIFYKTMEREWEQNPLMLFSADDFFEDDDEVETKEKSEEKEKNLDAKIKLNRFNAKRHGVQTDVSRILVAIPKDTPLTGDTGIVEVTDKARLALNATELQNLFTLFCRKNVGKFSKFDSTPVLQGAIESALEEYLQIFATDVPKVVLYHKNRPCFEELIRKALVTYEATLKRNAKDTEIKYQEFIWQVPETRLYNANMVRTTEGEIFNHALYPYFEQIQASKPEQDFARWLDDKMEYVDWWYKNGDEGKQHFAIPYTDSGHRKRCFYVDFIIRLKSGTVCLFDTKTRGSDGDAPEKNNALLEYISEYQAKGKNVVGGVLIKDETTSNWYYPGGIIHDTDHIDGWSALHLETL